MASGPSLVEGRPRVIEPSTGWIAVDLAELWEYRELFYFLTWRDIKVRYKQTVLGAAWAVIQPFFSMVVFSVFFGRLAGVPSDGAPYPVFAYAALVPWTFFANGVTLASNSLITGSNLVKKVYFPRVIVPAAAVLSGTLDFVLAFIVLVGLMLWFGIVPTVRVLAVPALFLLALGASLGVSLWLAALNAQFRDVRHAVPFLTQLWLFATPIAYPSSLLRESWRVLYAVNPMVGVVEGFRWALLELDGATLLTLAVSSCTALGLLITGALYFRRVEKRFADVL
jgi:homopolymeric O-antigen transport system permease protein